MIWASALSTKASASAALADIKRTIDAQLDGQRPDLVCAFVSSHHASHYQYIAQQCNALFEPRVSIGCSGAGQLGGGCEAEQGPALALCAAHLPDVSIHPFYCRQEQCPNADAGPDAWVHLVGAEIGRAHV